MKQRGKFSTLFLFVALAALSLGQVDPPPTKVFVITKVNTVTVPSYEDKKAVARENWEGMFWDQYEVEKNPVNNEASSYSDNYAVMNQGSSNGATWIPFGRKRTRKLVNKRPLI